TAPISELQAHGFPGGEPHPRGAARPGFDRHQVRTHAADRARPKVAGVTVRGAGRGNVSYPGPSVRCVTTIGDRLYFFSGSADLPPGQGVHEGVADPGRYAALAGVRHWRRMLSNF